MKRMKLKESDLRIIVKRLLKESNITSIFSARGSQVQTKLIEIRGTIVFSYNEAMTPEEISKFAANLLEEAAENSDGMGRWKFVNSGQRNLSDISGFENFSSSNGLALVSPFELIHQNTNRFQFFVEFLAQPNEDHPEVEALLMSSYGVESLKSDIQRELSDEIRKSFRYHGIDIIVNFFKKPKR
jgi:hypothetical protein